MIFNSILFKLQWLFVLSSIVLLSSCCSLHTEVEYQFEDVFIKRKDECGKTSFYYSNKNGQKEGVIWVEYSGINDGFSGYLVFMNNSKVQLMSGDGYFQSANMDTTVFNFKRILAYERPQLEQNVCVIAFPAKFEKESKNKHLSDIEIKYRIDENEWW